MKIIPSESFESVIDFEIENLGQNGINKFNHCHNIKMIISSINLKSKIWSPADSPGRLCKNHLHQVGFTCP